MEVLEGLEENANVVMNPTDDLREGVQVEIKPPDKQKAEGSAENKTAEK